MAGSEIAARAEDEYYLLPQDRDAGLGLPIRVRFNAHGHFMAAEIPGQDGLPVINNAAWTEIRDNPWLEKVDACAYDNAMRALRGRLEGNVLALTPAL